MERSQLYIGTPNGVVLCVDSLEGSRMKGRFYHRYSGEGIPFCSVDQLVFGLENFYDSVNFPYNTTNDRSFQKNKKTSSQKQERSKIMSDENLLSKHGDLGTFIIRVQHRQNSSWQGRLTWMDKNKTLYFRSIWEMIKMIASALDTVSRQEDEPREQSWEE